MDNLYALRLESTPREDLRRWLVFVNSEHIIITGKSELNSRVLLFNRYFHNLFNFLSSILLYLEYMCLCMVSDPHTLLE
jgi:hypothetical protein